MVYKTIDSDGVINSVSESRSVGRTSGKNSDKSSIVAGSSAIRRLNGARIISGRHLQVRQSNQLRRFMLRTGLSFFESFLRPDDLVVITGGAGGLGRQLTEALVAIDMTVVVLDIMIPEPINQISKAHYYLCDVCNEGRLEKTADMIYNQLGSVTVIINNAGITCMSSLLKMSNDQVRKVIDVNLISNFLVTKAFIPRMIQRERGYIVTISSVLGYLSPAKLSAYGASKAGQIAFHESLTYELGFNAKIKTLLICPGQMDTALFERARANSFLAPVLSSELVAKTIVKALQLGVVGELQMPLYARILPLFRALPQSLVRRARDLSGMDKQFEEGEEEFGDKCGLIEKSTNGLHEKAELAPSAPVLEHWFKPKIS